MNIPGLCVENFAPDALAVREAVIAGEFHTEQGPDGGTYTGIAQYPVPQWHERISEVLGRPIQPRLSCFRLNLKGELPHSWVHSDDICAKFASVLYLNPPEQCTGGTAFWKHAALGMSYLLSREELAAHGMDADAFYKLMNREWKDASAWQQVGFMPMVFNLFLTYPTQFFHSRWPWEGFGTSPQDGRLIWACFYDIEGSDE
jgi:uncharacterized protein DUF6445